MSGQRGAVATPDGLSNTRPRATPASAGATTRHLREPHQQHAHGRERVAEPAEVPRAPLRQALRARRLAVVAEEPGRHAGVRLDAKQDVAWAPRANDVGAVALLEAGVHVGERAGRPFPGLPVQARHDVAFAPRSQVLCRQLQVAVPAWCMVHGERPAV